MHNRAERLFLKGPAGTTWKTVAPVLARHLGEPTEDHCPWLLSGGTLLAARWDWHRDSNDIDVIVASDAALSLWPMADTDGQLERLDDDLERCGWIPDPTRTTAWQRGYQHPDTEQALDLFAHDLRPPMDPVRTQVDDVSAYTARTAQVLHGKLQGRSHRAPVRDLYDLAVAGRKDPPALRTALRHIDAATFTRNVAMQLQRTDQYRSEAQAFLTNPTHTHAAADPAPAAATAMIKNYPAIWHVKRSETSWRIETLNVYQRHLERLTGSDASDAGPYPVTAEQLGAPARELLRRAATDSQQIYRDERVTERVLALASEAQERARTPNPHGQTTEPAPPPPPRTGGWER